MEHGSVVRMQASAMQASAMQGVHGRRREGMVQNIFRVWCRVSVVQGVEQDVEQGVVWAGAVQ